jgi:hypothetical protein
MEHMANWGYLVYKKSFPNTQKVFKHIWRIRGKNLYLHGEDAKRLLAYSPNMPKDIKLCISQLIIIPILKFFRFFLSTLYGMDLAKRPSHAIVPLMKSGKGKVALLFINLGK